MLYTCAKEFDFLGSEMPWKATQTFLIPTVIIVLAVLVINTHKKLTRSDEDVMDANNTFLDPAVAYSFLQLCAFAFMAILIMRLKMFFVPQLCILAAFIANKRVSLLTFFHLVN